MSAMNGDWDRRSILRASAALSAPAALAGSAVDGGTAHADEFGETGAGPTTGKLPKPATAKGPAERFTGDVWLDTITASPEPSGILVAKVRFAPCSRTAWHRHALGQTLHVIEGIGLVRARGGKLIVMRSGDTVHTPPGEWHWHGAARDHFMSHLAMVATGGDANNGTEWGDHVTDDEYDGR